MQEQTALEGFRQLAFGDIRDAVKLLFCDELNTRALRKMNLFAVSEIRRPKGGGMEIRFFDRREALRLLSELESADDGADGLLRAIEAGAAALGEKDAGKGGAQRQDHVHGAFVFPVGDVAFFGREL